MSTTEGNDDPDHADNASQEPYLFRRHRRAGRLVAVTLRFAEPINLEAGAALCLGDDPVRVLGTSADGTAVAVDSQDMRTAWCVSWDPMAPGDKREHHQCGICQAVWCYDELNEAERSDGFTPGEIMPSGRCPACDCLCFLVRE